MAGIKDKLVGWSKSAKDFAKDSLGYISGAVFGNPNMIKATSELRKGDYEWKQLSLDDMVELNNNSLVKQVLEEAKNIVSNGDDKKAAIKEYLSSLRHLDDTIVNVLMKSRHGIDPNNSTPEELAAYHSAVLSRKGLARQRVFYGIDNYVHDRGLVPGSIYSGARRLKDALVNTHKTAGELIQASLMLAGITAIGAICFMGYNGNLDKATFQRMFKDSRNGNQLKDITMGELFQNNYLGAINHNGKLYGIINLNPGETLSHIQQHYPGLNLKLGEDFYWNKNGKLERIPNDPKVHKNIRPAEMIYISFEK